MKRSSWRKVFGGLLIVSLATVLFRYILPDKKSEQVRTRDLKAIGSEQAHARIEPRASTPAPDQKNVFNQLQRLIAAEMARPKDQGNESAAKPLSAGGVLTSEPKPMNFALDGATGIATAIGFNNRQGFRASINKAGLVVSGVPSASNDPWQWHALLAGIGFGNELT